MTFSKVHVFEKQLQSVESVESVGYQRECFIQWLFYPLKVLEKALEKSSQTIGIS